VKQRACSVFRDQRARYTLRFTCEHCSYFEPHAQRCSHGYPNQAHREAHYEEPDVELIFCKDFELK
jgi:hypothetical protein